MKKSGKWMGAIAVSFLMLLLILKPQLYMNAVADGLKLFAVSVLPAMFPFFFFSKLLTSLGVAGSLSSFTKKPVRFLYRAPDIGGYVLVMSMLSGYPVGARLVSDCCAEGLIDKEGAKSLISFTSTSGPIFVLGTVGAGMLGNYKAGIVILLSHYLGALINGLLYRGKKKETNNTAFIAPLTAYDSLLSDVLSSSIASTLAVGGYIALFNMAITALKDMSVISYLINALSLSGSAAKIGEGVLTGLVEVTRGCLTLSLSGGALYIIVPAAAALISFGGASVTLQSLTFLSKCGIKTPYYLLTKTTQALVTFAVALPISILLF